MIQLMFTDKFTSRNAVSDVVRADVGGGPPHAPPRGAAARRRVGRSKNLYGACSMYIPRYHHRQVPAGQKAKAKTAGDSNESRPTPVPPCCVHRMLQRLHALTSQGQLSLSRLRT